MHVESILRMNEFKSIKNKEFLKIMFCNGSICLKTKKIETLSHPFGWNHSRHLVIRYGTLRSELTVGFQSWEVGKFSKILYAIKHYMNHFG